MHLDDLLAQIIAWGRADASLRALALVGSHARGAARPDSDVDLVCLVRDPAAFRDAAWVSQIVWGAPVEGWHDRDYGALWSRHVQVAGAPEVEMGFAPLSWANTQPVDPGTQQVMSDGHRILYDPDGRLSRLAAAVTS